jgi:DNA-binding NtrC family response regulator
MERAVIIAGEGSIRMSDLPINLQTKTPVTQSVAAGSETSFPAPGPIATPVAEEGETVRVTIGTTVEEAEKNLILRTLEHTKNNKTRAAEILGISLKTLHNKLKEYGARDAAF